MTVLDAAEVLRAAGWLVIPPPEPTLNILRFQINEATPDRVVIGSGATIRILRALPGVAHHLRR